MIFFIYILPNCESYDIINFVEMIAILKYDSWFSFKSSWIMCAYFDGILQHILQFGILLTVDGWLNIIKILTEPNLFWSWFLSCWSNFMKWTLGSKDGFNPIRLASNWIEIYWGIGVFLIFVRKISTHFGTVVIR